MTRSDLTTAIEQLKTAASNLPPCDRAAKLKGLVLRLEGAVADGGDLGDTVTRLVHATELALDHDPWVQLDRIAQRLSHEISAIDPRGLAGIVHPTDASARCGALSGVAQEQPR